MLGGLGPLVPVSSTEGEAESTAAADAGTEPVEVADDDVIVMAPSDKDDPHSRPWTEEEEHTVRSLVLSHGTKRWRKIAAQLHGRTWKQCRERWQKGKTSLSALFPFFPPLRAMAPTRLADCVAPRLSMNHNAEAAAPCVPVRSASETKMLFAAAWQHEAAAAIQRQMRGCRATTAKGRPTTGWRSNQEAEMRNARLLQDNRDLKAANAELKTELQTELQRALTRVGRAPSCGATARLSRPLAGCAHVLPTAALEFSVLPPARANVADAAPFGPWHQCTNAPMHHAPMHQCTNQAHMSSKFEPERMEAELRTAAERAMQLELELDAYRTARAELLAGQAASEREAERLRTELQVAEEKLEASGLLRAGVRESSTLMAAVDQAHRSLPPSPAKLPPSPAKLPPSPTGAAAAGAAGAAGAAAEAGAAADGPTGCRRSSWLSLSTEEGKGAAEAGTEAEAEADGEADGEAEGAEVLWRLESWLSSLDLGAIVARAFLPALRAQSADLRLEKQFAARLGVRADPAEVAAMLRETAVLEQISAAISQGAHALHADGERRKGSNMGQLGTCSWLKLTPPPPSLGKFVEEREAGPPGVGEIGRVERGEYSGQHVVVIKEDGTRWQCELIKEDGSKGELVWLEMEVLVAVSPKLFTLTFGEPKDFVGGLVKLVGEPIGHRMLGMKQEHGAAADSHVEFEVGNYGTRTTSQLEWWFVVEPTAARLDALGRSAWPSDVKLREDPTMRHRCRAPLPLGSFGAQRAALNERLRELHTEVTDEEFIGARLYTGPMFMKYNTVLRGVHGKVPFFQTCFEKLCLGNRYVTTLHVIASALSKLALLGACETVYRGMSGGELPESFRRADASHFKGGVEFGFMSTTLNRDVAIEYASAGEGGIVFEIAMGFADKGAELSWLSQYPHEKEFCFPPLTGLSVRRSRVEGSALVLELLPRVAPSLSADGAADGPRVRL